MFVSKILFLCIFVICHILHRLFSRIFLVILFRKKTYLWTKGLPKLVPTDICESFVPYLSVCSSSKKMRSKTFPGIANAFAHQFSAAILSGNSFSLPYQTFLKDVIL